MCLTYQLGCSTNTVALWVSLIKGKGQINSNMPVSAKAYPLLLRKELRKMGFGNQGSRILPARFDQQVSAASRHLFVACRADHRKHVTLSE
jgi:hypothetical protein